LARRIAANIAKQKRLCNARGGFSISLCVATSPELHTDMMEQKCYLLCKTQTYVGYRAEPSRSSARFYIGALCNSAIKLAALPKGGAAFFMYVQAKPEDMLKPGGSALAPQTMPTSSGSERR
jgi:hypothetical protein